MRWNALVLCAAFAAAISVACTESDSASNESGAYFGRNPSAQATIRARHATETEPRLRLPSQGYLHATTVVDEPLEGRTRTESRFWFEDGVVSHAEYDVYDAVTGELLETQTTNGSTTRSSEGWTIQSGPDSVLELLPALSATFLVDVAEMTELASSGGTRSFEYRDGTNANLLRLIEIEAETNVIIHERLTRDGDLVTDRRLSYEILASADAPQPTR